MEELLPVSEYLIMGAMLCFMLLTACHFTFIVPRLAPNRSVSTQALHQMLTFQIVYNGLLYFLWLLPVFIDGRPTDFYVEDSSHWVTYHIVMDYLDMTLLPVGMLMGHVVTRGKLPSARMFILQVIPFFVALCLHLLLGWAWLRTVMGIFSILYSIFQFIWYGRCVRIHQLFLLNHFSNLDGREMKWYLKAQTPVFLLCLLYYPLCVLPEATWPSLVYDLLTLAVMVFLVIMVMLHEMDDKAYHLIKEVDFRKKESEILADAIKQAETEVIAPVAAPIAAAAATTMPEAAGDTDSAIAATEPQPAAAAPEPQPETIAKPEEPKEWTRVEKESYDFGDQMKQLEAEEFYLDPDVSIDYLAARLGSNRHYVSNYLNQILKMPFYTYVNKLRLEHAERLLRTSNDKASSIGYLCGFNSEGTFRRLFKEQFGCTPTQYIKRAA